MQIHTHTADFKPSHASWSVTLSVWTASGSVCANPKHSNTNTQCKDSIVVIIMLAVKFADRLSV